MSANVWRKCYLSSIADIIMGQSPNTESYNDKFGVPLIQGNADIKNRETIINGFTTTITKHGFPGDIIFTVRAPVGNVAKNKLDCCLGRGVCAFRNANEYLYHYLISIEDNWWKYSTGSTFDSVNAAVLQKTKVLLPKDPEDQKHISDILSTCDTVIQNTQKTIDKYKAIKQGMMQDLFTRGLTKDGKLRPSYKEAPELYKESELGMIPKEWSETPVIEIGEVISGGTPSTKNTDFWDGNIPFVTPNDLSVNEGAYITSTERYITVLGISKSSAIELPEGTLIISSRAPIGYLAIASFNCVTNQGCKSVVFDSKQDPLFHYYNFQRYVNKMKSLGSGTTFAEISKKDVEKLKVSYPLKDEQIEIAKRLSSIDSTIQKEEAILEKYKNIKTGLMARLLTPPEDAEIIDETGETL